MHRVTNDFTLHKSSAGNSEVDQQLQIYKTPAIIRDTKSVFFYVQIFANSTTISPLLWFQPAGTLFKSPTVNPIDLAQQSYYYAPIGTKRKFNIGEQINSLLDLRIPKDKYMVEINLSECQMETDPTNWVKQPDLDARLDPADGRYLVRPTYEVEYARLPITGSTAVGDDLNLVGPVYVQANKRTVPSPLSVRIPQLSNGEPYNWTVSSNGGVVDDKSHNPVLRHGDVNYQELELEFGHLVFKGKDNQYSDYGKSIINDPVLRDVFWEVLPGGEALAQKKDIKFYDDFEYLDYNFEWNNNVYTTATNVNQPLFNPVYQNPAIRTNGILSDKAVFEPGHASEEFVLAGTPLKTNQQVTSLLFRFELKVLHLF